MKKIIIGLVFFATVIYLAVCLIAVNLDNVLVTPLWAAPGILLWIALLLMACRAVGEILLESMKS